MCGDEFVYTAPGERLMLKTSEKQAQSLGQVRRESVASGKLTLAPPGPGVRQESGRGAI